MYVCKREKREERCPQVFAVGARRFRARNDLKGREGGEKKEKRERDGGLGLPPPHFLQVPRCWELAEPVSLASARRPCALS